MIEQPLPWVIGIARHKLLDHFRRQRPSNLAVQLAGQPDETLPAWPFMPIEVGNEEGILEALRAVPAAQRDALILHFMDDGPVTEVAEAARPDPQLGRIVDLAGQGGIPKTLPGVR